MIIKRCYVENFGTLSGQEFDFTDGLNIIKEDNGWGKSTLAVFIKCMFYGMEYKRRLKQIPEHKRYDPWQGGGYGGYVIFSVGDRTYRVTRYFGKKENECSFELYDLETNMISRDYSDKLGEELFGIDRESFERSIFIKLDSEKRSPEMSFGISAKLNNLVDNTDDINNFDSAYKMLDKLSVTIAHKRGSGGMIAETMERQRELEAEIFECDNAEREIAAQSETIRRSRSEKLRLEKRETEISAELEKIAVYDKNVRYTRLAKNENDLRQRKGIYEKFFASGVPDEAELAAMTKAAQVLEVSRARLEDISNIDQKRQRLSEAESYLEQNPKQEPKKEIKPNYALAVLMGVLAAVFIVAAVLMRNSAMMIIPVIAAAVSLALIPLQLRSRPADNSAEIARLEQEMIYNTLKGEIAVYDAAKARMEQASAELEPFLERYNAIGNSYFDKIQYIRDAMIEYSSVTKAYSDAKEELDEFTDINDMAAIEAAEPTAVSAAELEVERKAVSVRINELTAELARAAQSIERCTAIADRRQELESEKEAVSTQREYLLKRLDTINRSMSFLEKAKENLSTRYISDMTDAFDKYIHKLAPDRDDILLTAELDTQILSGGRAKESGYHSRGFDDMANISTRLALADVMYKNEKPLLILDDPFCNMDDKKIKNALDFLNEMGKDRQILYFTCHTSRTI